MPQEGMEMGSESLIGRCGLYCGACDIYRAERDDPGWRARIAASHDCAVEQVRCNGCGNLSPECWGHGCKIVSCTELKGVRFCFECAEYDANSCDAFGRLAAGYLEAEVDLRENLSRIREGKAQEWLHATRQRFTCGACGKPVAVWSAKCHHCGKSKS
jgi:hypothetical protein